MHPPLVLGTASPRRHKLLAERGVPFTIFVPETDETIDPADPVATVINNATAKHTACRVANPAACIITADTIVWFGGEIVGKPRDLNEAARMLHSFSGQRQRVYTAVVLSMPGKRPETRVVASSVHFKQLTANTIHNYLHTVKPLDRAGAYDIDESGDLLIESYSGSYSNIVGLPMECVSDWLTVHGF